MFISIIHGDTQEFLVNINCNVIHLLDYLKQRFQLPMTDTIDICDKNGSLKYLFLITNFFERAANGLTPHETYYVCKIVRGEPGFKHGCCYKKIILMLSNADPKITDALRAQCDLLEKCRLKLLRAYKAKQSAAHDMRIHSSSLTSQKMSRGALKLSEEEISNRNKSNNTRILHSKISDSLRKDKYKL
ncbi:uncharacterized protein CXorf65 homolog [Engystomops pustulosus]|uniref:uncharacterized protein CXorf65 homolog n=1 Tax=Engystomops pustulosus TaxID=76066 RepID=UPI003AFAC110